MSVWPIGATPGPALRGTEGELVSVRIAIEPRLLEQALETLARLEFPINPQIYHHPGPDTLVEFPAYTGRLVEVKRALANHGFGEDAFTIKPMLAELGATAAN